MGPLFDQLRLSAPLFALVALGFGCARMPIWRPAWTKLGSQFVFRAVLPLTLFFVMATRRSTIGADPRILPAFFGGCLIVFGLARWALRRLQLAEPELSVSAVSCVFSNNVLLGMPLAQAFWGDDALAPIALVLTLNALSLWTLASLSVAAGTRESPTGGGGLEPQPASEGAVKLLKSARKLLKVVSTLGRNPILAAIVLGMLYRALAFPVSGVFRTGLQAIVDSAGPVALAVLGMGLAGYEGPGRSAIPGWITLTKLGVQPLVVLSLALLLGLPELEFRVVVLLASLPVGANAYLMALHFGSSGQRIARALVLSTALGAVTTPLWVWVALRVQP